MALMSIVDQHEFESDLSTVMTEVRVGVAEDYAKRKGRHWEILDTYCHKNRVDPFLLDVQDSVPSLKFFQKRLLNNRAAPSGQHIGSKTVSNYITSVSQRFTNMGVSDPRLSKFGKIDFCVS